MIVLQGITNACILEKTRSKFLWFVIFTSILILGWREANPDAMLTGTVLRVADSEVIVLLGPGNAQYKIRLLGVDAPEQGQPYAEAAKDYISTRAIGRFVVVEYGGRDTNGNIFGTVRLSGSDLGLEQISAGMAWHYKQDQDHQSAADQRAYAEAEEQARQAQIGLWHDSCPVAPWVWREPKAPGETPPCDKQLPVADSKDRQ